MRMATTRILMGALVALQGGAALAATPVVTADRLLHVLAGRMVDKPAVAPRPSRRTRPASTCPARRCCRA